MNRTPKRMLPLVVCVALALAAPTLAAQYEVDTAHSAVSFKVKHLAISNVKGSFDEFAGTFTFDAAAPAVAAADIVIQAASISTGNAKRDEHLRSADFFDVEKFPTLTFKATGLTMSSATDGVLKGVLNLHGVSREVALAVTFNGEVKDPWGNEKAGFSASGKLDRRDFGLVYGGVMESGGLVVGNDIEFLIEIEGTKLK